MVEGVLNTETLSCPWPLFLAAVDLGLETYGPGIVTTVAEIRCQQLSINEDTSRVEKSTDTEYTVSMELTPSERIRVVASGKLITPNMVAWALARTRTPGAVFLHLVLWYSLLRSVLEEPFRDNPLFWSVYVDPVGGVGLFTLTQIISVPVVLVAAYLLWTRGAKT